MRQKIPMRAGRTRRALVRGLLAVTAFVTVSSLTVSTVGHAAAALPSAVPVADPGPAVPPLKELASYGFAAQDISDATVYDPTTRNRDGVLHNGAAGGEAGRDYSWAEPAAAGVQALVADGVDDFMSSSVSAPTDNAFTVAAWVKLSKVGGHYTAVSQDGTRVSGYYLKVTPDGKWQFAMPKSDSEASSFDTVVGPVAVVNEWTQLTGVYDAAAGQMRLYVNGRKAGSVAHTTLWKAGGGLQVGRGLYTGAQTDFWPGMIDSVHLWQGVLPDLELAGLTVAPDTARTDRCTIGHWLHAGGPAVKAVAGTALAGTDVDTRRAMSGFGMGLSALENAASTDEATTRTAYWAQGDRYKAWSAVVTQPLYSNGVSLTSSPPEYGAELNKFLFDRQDRTYHHYFDLPAPTKPTQAVLDRALALRAQLVAAEPTFDWLYPEWSVRAMDAFAIRKFLQFGGAPKSAPVAGSVEFRMEVEDLKVQWAGCGVGYWDQGGVMRDVAATANAEWQAELAAQAPQRAVIAAADLQTTKDLRTASQAMTEAQGQSWIAGQLLVWQRYWQGKPTSTYKYPTTADFAKANSDLAGARNAVGAQLTIARNAAASAKTQADKVTAAQAQATTIATTNGTPVGRGLAFAQQTAQAAKAASAAAQAASMAVEATLNAVKAANFDAAALQALTATQAQALQAEFDRAAAAEAAAQAHAAAIAAANQATQAAASAAKAKADRATAEQAERTATTAAAEAHAKRGVAEAERATAATAKAKAESERAKAAQFEAQAQAQQGLAATAQSNAQAHAATAATKRAEAEAAEVRASTAREAAVTAEERRDALNSRAAAFEATAAAASGTDAAGSARAAATAARADATNAGTAAAAARSNATAAGNAAVSARAAATEATGAAERARAAAAGADSAAATAWSAAMTGHAAAADAIVAAEAAAANVRAAQAQAATALAQATSAKASALAAGADADQALLDSARTAGQAYAATQSALAARDAATAAIAPANDAITMGSQYREADTSAGLAVLVGQSAMTVAQQQAAVGQARSDEAVRAAATAAATAAAAVGAAKLAAQAAANAAADAASAAASVEKARASAIQAAADTAAAKLAAAHTDALSSQAQLDAWAADAAAIAANSDAASARNSATAAEKDAASARTAANTAAGNAAAAGSAATKAETDAAAAETAAANAQISALEAQAAAKRAEDQKREAAQPWQLSADGPAGMAGIKAVPIVEFEDLRAEGVCDFGTPIFDPKECDLPVNYRIVGAINYFLPTCDQSGCFDSYLGSKTVNEQQRRVVHLTGAMVVTSLLEMYRDVLVGDFIRCYKYGTGRDCAMAALVLAAPPGLRLAAEALEAFKLAVITGVGLEDAWAVAKLSQLPAEAIAALDATRAATRSKFAGVLEGKANYDVVDPKTGNMVTDIDLVEGGVLWEEKSAGWVGDTQTWINKQVIGKFDKYLRARQLLAGYEDAPIGLRMEPGVQPDLKVAIEQAVAEYRIAHPGVDIRLEFL
ncbi:LamG domain-containing protein [Longispora sp. K20-0274]|uniref:LamG domain-containing protein n=1 Tax=Longispora sp. K20-0274 TaxID=3088255 RepID=UPI00399A2254